MSATAAAANNNQQNRPGAKSVTTSTASTDEYKPFEIIEAKPQAPIRSEDWNNMQKGLLAEIQKLRQDLESMTETIILSGLSSRVGTSYDLDQEIRYQAGYGEKSMGLITQQWVTSFEGAGEICSFGILEPFDRLYYWAGAERGDKKTLDIIIEYMERPEVTVGSNLYINDRWNPPTNQSPDNPWLAVMKSRNDLGWYKYQLINPYPAEPVKYVRFNNTDASCTPRIANVVHLKTKVQSLSKYY